MPSRILNSIVFNDANKVLFNDVQGDVLAGGLPKNHEVFLFFSIQPDRVKTFCINLGNATGNGLLTFSSVQNIIEERQKIQAKSPGLDDDSGAVTLVGVNIAFSFRGLTKMSSVLAADLNLGQLPRRSDEPFITGMKKDSVTLADPPSAFGSESKFAGDNIDGVLIVAGSDGQTVDGMADLVMKALGFTRDTNTVITEITREVGHVRDSPNPANRGKEHFGFEDGISQPAIRGIDDILENIPNNVIDRSVILCDTNDHPQQPWIKNGSFLCFRKLEQDVAKWDDAVTSLATKANIGRDLVGAKLIGRFLNGCPVMLSPTATKADLIKLPQSNAFSNFNTSSAGSNADNSMCPLGAHIRKTNPRDGRETHRILRHGISYGPDYDRTKDRNDPENAKKRGLLFACYQSNLTEGFKFIQKSWANNPGFPGRGAGLDLVMGQTGSSAAIPMDVVVSSGQQPVAGVGFSGINEFVKCQGGEYFFTPSISALRGPLSKLKTGGRSPVGSRL